MLCACLDFIMLISTAMPDVTEPCGAGPAPQVPLPASLRTGAQQRNLKAVPTSPAGQLHTGCFPSSSVPRGARGKPVWPLLQGLWAPNVCHTSEMQAVRQPEPGDCSIPVSSYCQHAGDQTAVRSARVLRSGRHCASRIQWVQLDWFCSVSCNR
jgi:hypothetical protein